MIQRLCPKCRAEVRRIVLDLGKTEGEEGHDFLTVYRCQEHGDFLKPITISVCDHCRQEKPLSLQIAQGCDEEYAVMVCSEECRLAMCDTVILTRADFVPWHYTAKPARDGKVRRLQCCCGELADGQHWKATTGDCIAYRCDNCLPKI